MNDVIFSIIFDPKYKDDECGRKHVSSLPKDGAFPGLSDSVVLLVLRQHLGQPEIPDLHPHLTFHQNISSGQVSVDVTFRGEVVHPLEDIGLYHHISQVEWVLSYPYFYTTCESQILRSMLIQYVRQTSVLFTALYYLANLWCVVHQLLWIKVRLVFDEIISQTAVGEIFHDQPQVPSSCQRETLSLILRGEIWRVRDLLLVSLESYLTCGCQTVSSYLHCSRLLCIWQCSRAGGIWGSQFPAQSLWRARLCYAAVSSPRRPPLCCPAGGHTCTSPRCQNFPAVRQEEGRTEIQTRTRLKACVSKVFCVGIRHTCLHTCLYY